jgi:hypothetical protein
MHRLLAAFFAVMISACASMAQDEGELIALNTSEISTLLEGSYVDYPSDPGFTPSTPTWRESYCRGTMTTRGSRVPVAVRPYTIEDDRLCLHTNEGRYCRSFYRDAAGSFYFQTQESEPRPVRTGREEGFCND